MKKRMNILPVILAVPLMLGGCATAADSVQQIPVQTAASAETAAPTEMPVATPEATPAPASQEAEQMVSTAEPMSRTELMLGTACTIILYDHKEDAIMQHAFDYIDKVGREVSVNESGTEIDKVNEKAGIEPVQVSPDAYELIKLGLQYCAVSEGEFDISIGPLTSLWRIGFPDARVPSQQEIDAAIPLVDYKEVELNDADQTVYLPRAGMKLDLGGIAKGYIADETVKILQADGVTSGIVNLGGSSQVMIGSKLGQPWVAAVQDPQRVPGDNIGYMYLTDTAIGTSGIYERYIEQDGKTYHHMLDPKTGYPFDSEVASATVISKLAIDGDGYTTTLCGLGVEKGLAMAESLPGIEAVFVTKDHKVYITSGLEGNFILANDSYTMGN